MQRISKAHLQAKIDQINRATNSPREPYTKGDDGLYHANIGNYHLAGAYGGHQLHRMHTDGGGVTEPLGGGYISKRELNERLHAFLAGLEARTA